ncbi:MAG: transcriptional modulator of MazE/toxin, MazF [Chloroflexi bacterium]|nr:transcriptional modulator of MazE/toxin, MazF [Chloroflexota bacterium]
MNLRPLARGDVVLVRFPFTDLTGAKLRPALVLALSGTPDVVLAFITSQPLPESHANAVIWPADPEFLGTGLKVVSTVRLDKLATLRRDLVLRRLGRIGPATGQLVARALRAVFNLQRALSSPS